MKSNLRAILTLLTITIVIGLVSQVIIQLSLPAPADEAALTRAHIAHYNNVRSLLNATALKQKLPPTRSSNETTTSSSSSSASSNDLLHRLLSSKVVVTQAELEQDYGVGPNLSNTESRDLYLQIVADVEQGLSEWIALKSEIDPHSTMAPSTLVQKLFRTETVGSKDDDNDGGGGDVSTTSATNRGSGTVGSVGPETATPPKPPPLAILRGEPMPQQPLQEEPQGPAKGEEEYTQKTTTLLSSSSEPQESLGDVEGAAVLCSIARSRVRHYVRSRMAVRSLAGALYLRDSWTHGLRFLADALWRDIHRVVTGRSDVSETGDEQQQQHHHHDHHGHFKSAVVSSSDNTTSITTSPSSSSTNTPSLSGIVLSAIAGCLTTNEDYTCPSLSLLSVIRHRAASQIVDGCFHTNRRYNHWFASSPWAHHHHHGGWGGDTHHPPPAAAGDKSSKEKQERTPDEL